jgi:hypothetical protein
MYEMVLILELREAGVYPPPGSSDDERKVHAINLLAKGQFNLAERLLLAELYKKEYIRL